MLHIRLDFTAIIIKRCYISNISGLQSMLCQSLQKRRHPNSKRQSVCLCMSSRLHGSHLQDLQPMWHQPMPERRLTTSRQQRLPMPVPARLLRQRVPDADHRLHQQPMPEWRNLPTPVRLSKLVHMLVPNRLLWHQLSGMLVYISARIHTTIPNS